MTETKQPTWQEILRRPFPPDVVKWRPGKISGDKGLAFAYVDARDVMDRFDEAFGPDRWQSSYKVLTDEAVECTITVLFFDPNERQVWVSKSNVGYRNDSGNADTKETEWYKAAYSDAFKRVSVDWGIGRELYDTPQFWLPVENKRFTSVPVWVDGKGWIAPTDKPEPIDALTKRKVQNALAGQGFNREQAVQAVKIATGKDSLNLLTKQEAEKVLTLLSDEKFVATIKTFAEDAA